MNAYLFPGQGAQYVGMGKNLYESSDIAKAMFEEADKILGFSISETMFEGSAEDLKQTKITQPAIFLYSVIKAAIADNFSPQMVAGHSLGEFSALVSAGSINFADGLLLVYQRAMAMQAACELNPSTMAAVLGLADEKIEEICQSISHEVVVAANYNCPGQVVISGSFAGIEAASELLKAAGAKRVLPLQVGGAFHSPLMEPAREKLAIAIENTTMKAPICPIYQNVNAAPALEVATIKQNLIAQLTAPVRWTQSIQNMIADGALNFIECGPGNVLQGLVKKINAEVSTSGIS
ncbi:MAG: ACP S-malonyltransferase [Bacteroidota bacterium]